MQILSWKTQLNLDQRYHPRIVTLIEQANPNCYLDCYDSYCCQVFNCFYLLAEDIMSIAKLKLLGSLCLWWGNLLHQLQLVRNLRLSRICIILTCECRVWLDLSKVDLSRFEAQQCCVQNHGFLAEPASQEEHDLIKQHLVISEISHCHCLSNIGSIYITFIICQEEHHRQYFIMMTQPQVFVVVDGADAYTSYWLGGSDFYGETT